MEFIRIACLQNDDGQGVVQQSGHDDVVQYALLLVDISLGQLHRQGLLLTPQGKDRLEEVRPGPLEGEDPGDNNRCLHQGEHDVDKPCNNYNMAPTRSQAK
jgi:hypothetical protein